MCIRDRTRTATTTITPCAIDAESTPEMSRARGTKRPNYSENRQKHHKHLAVKRAAKHVLQERVPGPAAATARFSDQGVQPHDVKYQLKKWREAGFDSIVQGQQSSPSPVAASAHQLEVDPSEDLARVVRRVKAKKVSLRQGVAALADKGVTISHKHLRRHRDGLVTYTEGGRPNHFTPEMLDYLSDYIKCLRLALVSKLSLIHI
eukprot:TRINITY_DN7314_c0_g1_i1.p1 TRINITY_DN7314_c0_g1~~TRINITY_DN7314_c0_g1_i1.p1  ORF type:complete len:205 (+),score=42.60 TRINITY_DN7314_c0_g1_i1:98-712(+)